MFHIVDLLSELEFNRTSCDFCKMRWEACHHLDRSKVPIVRFDRDQSMLRLNEGLLPVLSICRSPDFNHRDARVIQIGLPRVTETFSSPHFGTLRHWISECDTQHPTCHPPPNKVLRPPTRLIDVGTQETPIVRLFDTQRSSYTQSSPSSLDIATYKYIALSHPWGAPPHFCTYVSTLAQHKQGIPTDGADFPDTFRHAITITRELGLRYLWVDSICIIQGEDGDFDVEAKRMEDVFSSAYCVIAASSARGQRDGFLGARKERQFLRLGDDTGAERGGLYVCRFIDNFGEHVLDSPLSKRGWVLQERALARRTIYFTDWQAYWECGDGVRCETMTKIDNKLASFLGDPNFPSKLSDSLTDRGEKIRFYESLYQQYSRLDFTRIADRPVAIAGLEQRMLRDLGARGCFGIFDDGRSLLPRSLLWRRGKEVGTLQRIPAGTGKGDKISLPSWSWMAYDGAIDFLDLPLGGVEWNEDQIHGPWSVDGEPTVAEEVAAMGLGAVVRPFLKEPVDLHDQDEEDFEVVLDAGENAGTAGWEEWRCVVVGTKRVLKGGRAIPVAERTHYFLILKAAEGRSDMYNRIGVGKMAGTMIGGVLSSRVVVR
ncbi:heterokaryon incompatibility protein-domain-containing protein [Immersiella caudata]|uniref:Heterokaryon incompatibility protein-domain-containing protein n=1 Tax=Immersiella caudata TaxID=314043 RepID=A0AA39TP45_9PEZI|nr:heterokaryon incompatibility protein-domain-containing protein [Immersiella caudata]